MKKLVNLSPSEVEFVLSIARQIGDSRAVKGNFSKALRYIIEEYKCGRTNGRQKE